MEEKPSKAGLIKEFYAEELETDIKPSKASDVAARITRQIKEMLLEENAETVASMKADMSRLVNKIENLKGKIQEIKEKDFRYEAAIRFKEAQDHVDNGIADLNKTINERLQNVRADVLEHLDEQIAARANSENPFLTEVEGFMAIMRKYEAQEETVSDGLCALLNSLSFVYWKRIEASMEKNGKDTFTPYQRKAGRRL
jgi:exonuclease VII large subunit